MEEKDKIIVKWAQEDVETSNNLLNKYTYIYIAIFLHYPINGTIFAKKVTEHLMLIFILSANISETFSHSKKI